MRYPQYVVFSCLLLFGCAQENPVKKNDNSPLSEKERQAMVAVLRTSKNREELTKTALALCRGNDQASLDAVLSLLDDAGFLDRLDNEDDYNFMKRDGLRVDRIVWRISELSPKVAIESLLRLAKSKFFTAEHTRVIIITAASANIREPSPDLLKFVESQEAIQGEAMVVSVLAGMQSPEACKLIEKRFYSSDYPPERKLGWFKYHLITQRNAPAIVAMYKRILSAVVSPSDLRNMIVLSLFDYQAEKWYGDPPSIWPKAPLRRDGSTEVLKELLVIAGMCDKLDLEKGTRESVARERKKIETILEYRALGADGHAKLIRELGDDDFKVRDRAQREFERFGDAAEPVLREALNDKHLPFETRQRIEKILEKLKK